MKNMYFDDDPFDDDLSDDDDDPFDFDMDDVLTGFSESMFDRYFSMFCVQNPFFSFFSGIVEKIPEKRLPTIGVAYSLQRNKFSILYNIDFLSTLTLRQLFGVLEHEFYHIVLGHTQFRTLMYRAEESAKFKIASKSWGKPDEEKEKISQEQNRKVKYLSNIAKDLAINSLIERRNLPDIGVFPGEGRFKKYRPLQSSEEYFRLVMADPEIEKEMDQGEGLGSLDHEGELLGESLSGEFQDLEGAFNDAQKSELDGNGSDKSLAFELLNQAITQASKVSNKIPQAVNNLAFKKIKKSIPWNKILAQRITRFSYGQKKSFKSIRRLNHRYPYIFAGTRKKTVLPKILVAIDESGSVGDKMYKTLVSTLFALKSIANFYFVPFTHVVHPPAILMKEKSSLTGITRRYCGGTNFQSVVDFAQNEKYDFLVILTDLFDQPPSSRPGNCIPRIFVAECNSQYYIDRFKACNEEIILVNEEKYGS